jgi:outer membrane biogenesis lipoprotein LolB
MVRSLRRRVDGTPAANSSAEVADAGSAEHETDNSSTSEWQIDDGAGGDGSFPRPPGRMGRRLSDQR